MTLSHVSVPLPVYAPAFLAKKKKKLKRIPIPTFPSSVVFVVVSTSPRPVRLCSLQRLAKNAKLWHISPLFICCRPISIFVISTSSDKPGNICAYHCPRARYFAIWPRFLEFLHLWCSLVLFLYRNISHLALEFFRLRDSLAPLFSTCSLSHPASTLLLASNKGQDIYACNTWLN